MTPKRDPMLDDAIAGIRAAAATLQSMVDAIDADEWARDPDAASNAREIEKIIAGAVDHLLNYETDWLANRRYAE